MLQEREDSVSWEKSFLSKFCCWKEIKVKFPKYRKEIINSKLSSWDDEPFSYLKVFVMQEHNERKKITPDG